MRCNHDQIGIDGIGVLDQAPHEGAVQKPGRCVDPVFMDSCGRVIQVIQCGMPGLPLELMPIGGSSRRNGSMHVLHCGGGHVHPCEVQDCAGTTCDRDCDGQCRFSEGRAVERQEYRVVWAPSRVLVDLAQKMSLHA